MARANEDALERWLGVGIVIAVIGVGISALLNIHQALGIVLATVLVFGGGHLYAFYRYRAIQTARRCWDEQIEESRRKELRCRFAKQRQLEDRQKAEAALAERKRSEEDARVRVESMERWKLSGMPRAWVRDHLDGYDEATWAAFVNWLQMSPFWPLAMDEVRTYLKALYHELRAERDCAQEKQRKQVEGQTKLATGMPLLGDRTTCAQLSIPQGLPVDSQQNSNHERRKEATLQKADNTARSLARVVAVVARKCRGIPTIPVTDVRRMITQEFSKICKRDASLHEIGTIEVAVVEKLAATYFAGWIYLPVKRSELTAKPAPRSAKENASPWQENAIRAMEGE